MSIALKRSDLIAEPARLDTTAFATDVVAGLSGTPKRLPPKYFYDSTGSELFEKITELPEYYPTRTEIGILNEHAQDIAALIPKGAALIEFGSGASTKTRIVLKAAQVASYVPVDISGDFLAEQAETLKREFPNVAMLPVAADFTKPFDLPVAIQNLPRVGFFPGSTIGNFEPHEAASFLKEAGKILGEGSMLIVGVDLVKDQRVLQKAYNDTQRVTAKFNLNLLTRMNRELGANFNLASFEHHAFFKPRALAHRNASGEQEAPARHRRGRRHRVPRGRNDPHREQLQVHGRDIRLHGARAGWTPTTVWTDKDKYFSVQVLTRSGDPGGQALAVTGAVQRRFLSISRPEPARGFRGRCAGRAQIRLAHQAHLDPIDKRAEHPEKGFIVGTLWREQHDRVIGRNNVLWIVEDDESELRDAAVAGVARNRIDIAVGRSGIHELRLHRFLFAE